MWAVGAIIQVSVIALFVILGSGEFGPGVFEYEALNGIAVGAWAAAITGLQVMLLGVLTFLASAIRPPTQRGL